MTVCSEQYGKAHAAARITAAVLLLAFSCLAFSTGSGTANDETSFRLAIPLYAEDGPLPHGFTGKLKDLLRPEDILFVRGGEEIPLVQALDRGKVALVSPSLEGLEKGLTLLLSRNVRVDFLCYSPDALSKGDTPQEEKDDPRGAVKKARALAQEHGLGLILSPDTSVTLLAFGADMAPHADIFMVQLQRWQLFERETFMNMAERTIWWVRKGSSDVPVFAQLSTNPPVHRKAGIRDGMVPASADDMMERVRALENRTSGAAFLLYTADNGPDRFLEFLRMLRPPEHGG
ncbi:MAG: hypothetical protein JSU90_11330 [Nitrospiraceae bacterium]|nr:MAG: hypothetical protein JSU90_11330 [Nitrospiraceae bacterium]